MKSKFDHISIVVECIDEAKKWFGKYFGFTNFIMTAPIKATGGPGTRCLISDADGMVLELCAYENDKNMETGNIQHLGFIIDSAQEYYDVLKSDGVITEECIQDMGPVNILFFKGIYDIEFELIEKTGAIKIMGITSTAALTLVCFEGRNKYELYQEA